MDNTGITVYTSEGHQIDLTTLHIRQMIPLRAGTLIIKDLPEFPPVSCSRENCYEFAIYITLFAAEDLDHMMVFSCKEHHDDVLKTVATTEPKIFQ
jgi:hypothetical protein